MRGKFGTLVVLGVGLMVAGIAGCQQAPAPAPSVVVEDNTHHKWDEHEASAYQRWEAEKQKPHQEYTARPPQEQHDYWDWRKSHPD
jgi:hypothetical protein